MADFGLGGWVEGQRAYRDDALKLAQFEQSKLNSEAQRRNIDSSIAARDAEVQLARESAAAESARAAALARFAVEPSGEEIQLADMEQVLLRQASALAKLGDAKGAAELTQKASQVASGRQSVEASRALTAKRALETELMVLEDVQRLWSGVETREQHEAALLAAMGRPWAQDPNFQLPEALRTFDRRAIRAMVANSKPEIERRKLLLQEADNASKDANRRSQIATRNARLGIYAAEVKDRAAHRERLAKTGADPKVTEPPKPLVDRASAELKRLKIDIDATDRGAAAYDMAAEAKRRADANPAMSREEALSQVIQERIKAGDFKPGGMLFGKGKYEPKPGTLGRPAPLPDSRDKLQDGLVYRSEGGLFLYKGGQFKAVEAKPPVPRSNVLLEDDDEGDEE